MSVAAQEAVVLRDLLEDLPSRPPILSTASPSVISRRSRPCLAAPWSTALTDFVHPETRGERPSDLENRLRYGAALTDLAARDPEVHKLMVEVIHLTQPADALREPALARRVMALMHAPA